MRTILKCETCCFRLLCFILEKYGTVLNKSEHTDLVDLLEEYSDETQQKNDVTEKDNNVQLIRPLPIIRYKTLEEFFFIYTNIQVEQWQSKIMLDFLIFSRKENLGVCLERIF